jgi:hypothetical protein
MLTMQTPQTPLTQRDAIVFYRQLRRESQSASYSGLRAHYEQALSALHGIIESFGPTPEYYDWLGESRPNSRPDQFALTADL